MDRFNPIVCCDCIKYNGMYLWLLMVCFYLTTFSISVRMYACLDGWVIGTRTYNTNITIKHIYGQRMRGNIRLESIDKARGGTQN